MFLTGNSSNFRNKMEDLNSLSKIYFNEKHKAKIISWKIKPGSKISNGTLLLLYESENNSENKSSSTASKMKSTDTGTIVHLVKKEGDKISPGDLLLTLQSCTHPIVMKEMCAECGADLKQTALGPPPCSAAIAMVHSIPELIVSQEQAHKLGKADEEYLLRNRKLVLLVDLDQTLIHTTNDNIPPNIKDVYHFQLYGQKSPWYHTRLRPGTREFLVNISKYYELHICTFGARTYAHMIAQILDKDGKYFSHRILSRDECFNPTSKTANLKALFPCGDSMVCIIDDREDVWSYAPNLVHVKPYHFFQHTGDINAPPGLAKTENDNDAPMFSINKVKSLNNNNNKVIVATKQIKSTQNEQNKENEILQDDTISSSTTNVIKAENSSEYFEIENKVTFSPITSDINENSEGVTEKEPVTDDEITELGNNEQTRSSSSDKNAEKIDAIKSEDVVKNIIKHPCILVVDRKAHSDEGQSDVISETNGNVNGKKEIEKQEQLQNKCKDEKDLGKIDKCILEKDASDSDNVASSVKNIDSVASSDKNIDNVACSNKNVDEVESVIIKDINIEMKVTEQSDKMEVDKENSDRIESKLNEPIITNNEILSSKCKVDNETEMTQRPDIMEVDKENNDKTENKINEQIDTVQDHSQSKCNEKEKQLSEKTVVVNEHMPINNDDKENEIKNDNTEEDKCIIKSDQSNLMDIENETNSSSSRQSYSGLESVLEKIESITEDQSSDNVTVEDNDDHLLHLEEKLRTIHRAYYEMYDQMKDQRRNEIPDVKYVVTYVKRKILKGTNIVFSGVIPTNMQPEKSKAWIVAKQLGAIIQANILPKGKTHGPNATTHVIAAKLGTAKVNEAKKMKGIHIVNPDWLWSCAERWERVDERLFPLTKSTTPEPIQYLKPTFEQLTVGSDVNTEKETDSDSIFPTYDSKTGKRILKKKKTNQPPDPSAFMGSFQSHNTNKTSSGQASGASDEDNSETFVESINPLLSFSTEDIASMDKEVEDIFNESDSGDGSSDKEPEVKISLKRKGSSSDTESSSQESLSAEHPRGWGTSKHKRICQIKTDEEESNSEIERAKFPRCELPYDSDRSRAESSESDYNESIGSVDEEMAAAVEREFLGQ